MANANLTSARNAKQDEFYTQYNDIQKEVNAYIDFDKDVFRDKTILLPCDDPEWSNFTKFFAQNFENFGIKKLISTSYAVESKKLKYGRELSLFQDELFLSARGIIEPTIDKIKGKIFTLTRENYQVNYHNIKWSYLKGDGDFRSEEVKKLRDEADFVITNPPFSLFREFVAWIIEKNKKFLIIGSMNAITYKEIFPFIKDNKLWLGATGFNTDMVFGVPNGTKIAPKDKEKAEKLGYEGNYTRLGNSCWFTNIDHGRRHQPLKLMTMEDNIKFNKKLKGQSYQKYDNYDAIEVPYTDAIPSDYDGVMGVPISFLDKYCPEQFEIVSFRKGEDGKDLVFTRERERESSTLLSYPCSTSIPGMIKNAEGKINGRITYARITIKRISNQ